MKIIFAGTPKNAALTLRALKNSGIEIAGVITRCDAPVGRKNNLEPSAVAIEAESLGLSVLKTNAIDDAALSKMKDFDADLGVVVAYGAFLGTKALNSLDKGWINLHYSLLPKYRGAAPVQHAILNGESQTGVTVFQIEIGMDSGPTYISVPTAIEPGESAERLLDRLTTLGSTALLEILPAIAAGIAQSTAQQESAKSFAPKISRVEAEINWNKPAAQIENLINAMNPEPMAWSTLDSNPIRVISGRESRLKNAEISIGQVLVIEGDVVVGCQRSGLILEEIQPAGKSPMSAVDWMRGQKNKGPLVFGT